MIASMVSTVEVTLVRCFLSQPGPASKTLNTAATQIVMMSLITL